MSAPLPWQRALDVGTPEPPVNAADEVTTYIVYSTAGSTRCPSFADAIALYRSERGHGLVNDRLRTDGGNFAGLTEDEREAVEAADNERLAGEPARLHGLALAALEQAERDLRTLALTKAMVLELHVDDRGWYVTEEPSGDVVTSTRSSAEESVREARELL